MVVGASMEVVGGRTAFGLSPYLVGQAVSGEAETLVAWPLALVALLLERGGRRAAIAAGCVAHWGPSLLGTMVSS